MSNPVRRGLFLAVIGFWLCQCSMGTTTVKAGHFGIEPNTDKDVTVAFRDALEQCREKGIKQLSLAPGRYNFWPDSAVRREM